MERQQTSVKSNFNTAKLIKISLLGAISFVLMALDFALPIFPSFLKIDLGDIPSLIGGFALGPVAGILIQLIKNLLKLVIMGSQTGSVGEIANFFIGSAFVAVSSVIYKHHKGIKSAVLACILGTLSMTLLGALANYFVMIPLYAKFMPMDAIIGMGSAINPAIHDLFTFVLYAIVPFNIFKGVLISLITLGLYKKISPLLKNK